MVWVDSRKEAMSQQFLGFPPPLLGTEAQRLPVVYDNGETMALAKPAGVLVQQDGWYPRHPELIEAIRYQARSGKPEFGRLAIPEDGLWGVTDLDPECAGPVLFSRSRDRAEELRNEHGSELFEFTYILLTQGSAMVEQVECDLPLARHTHRAHMVVSHSTGKKAATVFRYIGRVGRHSCYEARTRFPRRHQILLHAHESGLSILGDDLYAGSRLVYLSSLKKDYRPRRDMPERPLYPGPAYYLKSVTVPGLGNIDGGAPRRWEGLCQQLSRHG
jgi:23S rRNA-/tRNA-specific pseudouridylate synthase